MTLKDFSRQVGRITRKIDKTGDLMAAFEELAKTRVLVGIPEGRTERKEGELTNAEIGFLMTEGVRSVEMRQEMDASGLPYSQAHAAFLQEHGEPIHNVPPRPFLKPAIEADSEKIANELGKVLKVALSGKKEGIQPGLERTGLLAQNLVKSWFTDPRNGWEPNAPMTIDLKGSDKPLIDTGQLRNSIHYVVEGP